MEKIEFSWKPITEIPTEHWDRNDAISPKYLVKCGEENGVSILGYSNYSFIGNCWIDVCRATHKGIHKVTEWTDVKI
jgi:hypothetical protein